MKKSNLILLTLIAAFAAGCASIGGQAGSQSAAQSAPAVDDATLVTRVQDALKADPDASKLKVNVTASKGTVTVKGEVKTLVLWKKVEGLVRNVAGVRSVQNQLIVTG